MSEMQAISTAELKELRQSVARLKALFSNVAIGAIVVDGEKRIVDSNSRFQEMLGYSAKELVGVAVLDLTHPDDRQLTRDYHHAVESRAQSIFNQEKRYIRKDGTTIWVRVSISMIENTAEESYYGTALIEDITEKKAQEEKISQQNARLIASSKLSSLGEMAAGIAHEINNPLMIIQGYAEDLKSRLVSGKPDLGEVNRACDRMITTVSRISRTVQALRAFARETANDPIENFPVRSIVEDTLALCAEKLKAGGVSLAVDAISDDLKVRCRPVQISQVLLNLINNAYDAVAGTPAKTVKIQCRESKDQIELKVSDSGVGVPPELREKIFEPFFTTKGFGTGTGLGLSVSAGMIAANLGTLELDTSSPETRFVIRLPKAQIRA